MIGTDGRGRRRPPCPGAVAAPRPRTPLFGRDDELASVLRRLRRGEVRLVTLTGLPGVGKTRLALELALWSRLPAWLVEAGPWIDAGRDRARRAGRGSTSGGDGGSGDRPAGPALLVVDDVPAGRPAAIAFGRLLDTCPGLVVVATAAAPLRIRGEQLLRVGPLPVPDPGQRGDDLAAVPSVALFLEASTRNDDRFWAGAEGLTAAAEICRRLGGLPLALELAAARSATLPLPLLARLLGEDDPLTLLDGGAEDAPERQRSLRAALVGCVDALRPAEREIAVLLASQPGDASWESVRAAAARVGAAGTPLALDALAGLVDAGLVQVVPQPDGERAFALAPLVRGLVATLPVVKAPVAPVRAPYRVDDAASDTAVPAPPVPDRDPAIVDLRAGTRLTARELEVLVLLAQGDATKEVARRLGISSKTVMHHSVAIYRKLEARGRAQAIDRAHRLGLLSPDPDAAARPGPPAAG